MASERNEKTNLFGWYFKKSLVWVLGAISSLCSYIVFQQKDRIDSLEKTRLADKQYYQKIIEQRDNLIITERRQKDSLQGLLLIRTDRSFEELKNLMNIRTKTSTITIKPKNSKK